MSKDVGDGVRLKLDARPFRLLAAGSAALEAVQLSCNFHLDCQSTGNAVEAIVGLTERRPALNAMASGLMRKISANRADA